MSGRSTIILREISSDAPEEEVREIFNYEGCKPIVSMRSDIGDTWFVVFESEDDAKDTLLDLRLKKRTFRDQSVKGRVKSETIARSFYPLQPPPPIVFPNMQFPIMGGPNMIPGPFSPFMMVPGMVPGMMPGMVPGGMIPITLASPMGIMAPTFEGESGKIESTRSHDSNNADGTTTTSHSDHAEQAHQNQSGDSKNNRVNGKNGVPQNGVNTSASANKDANSAINRPKSVGKDAAVKDAKKVGATSSGVASGASTGANGANRSTGGANNSNSSNNNSKSRDRSGGNARKENSSSTTAVSKSLPIEISTINFPPLVSPPHTSEGETSSGRKSEDDTSTQHHLTESFAAAAAGHASHSKATESTTPQVSSTPNIVVTSTNTDTSPVIDVTFGDIDISATTMPVEVILPSTTAATSVSTSKGTSSWAALVKSSPGPTVEASAKPVPSSSSASTNSNTNKSSATKEKTTSTATAAEIKGGTSGNNSNNNDNKKEKRREKKTDSSHHKSSTSSSLSQNLSNLNLPKDGQLNFTGDSENNEVNITITYTKYSTLLDVYNMLQLE